MFYNARWYDQVTGRFTQPDTIIPESSQGTQAWDRYAYVSNSPVRYTDPTGHCLGFSNCFGQVGQAALFLARRIMQKGNLQITDTDWEDAANYAAPAIASGSKESVSVSYGAFATAVKSTTLITTDGGDIQVFDESNIDQDNKLGNKLGIDVPEGAGLPGVTFSATHGMVFGLNHDARNYSEDAVQLSVGVPVATLGGVAAEGYVSPNLKVSGVDLGLYVGIGPTILSTAKTYADPYGNGRISGVLKDLLPPEVHGFGLFACRMASMCGAL